MKRAIAEVTAGLAIFGLGVFVLMTMGGPPPQPLFPGDQLKAKVLRPAPDEAVRPRTE